MKDTELSTGKAAKLCGVASRTVCGWCDRGILPSYRLADSKHRRIQRKDLLALIKKYGMPIPKELVEEELK